MKPWQEQLGRIGRGEEAAFGELLGQLFDGLPLRLAIRDDTGFWRETGRIDAGGAFAHAGPDPLEPRPDDPALVPELGQACAVSGVAARVALPAGDVALGDAALVLPLLRRATPTAALLLPDRARAELGAGDLERLWATAQLGVEALAAGRDRARLRELEARGRREMREVARIQRRLLPLDVSVHGAEIAAQLDTFGLAGGDYYDYMPLTHYYSERGDDSGLDVTGTMVADVTGHGAAAAVEAAMFDALLRTYPGDPHHGPQDVLSYVNRHFFTRQGRSHLITVFSAICDAPHDALHYANAGHPPAFLRRAGGGGVERLEQNAGIPIGVLPDYEYEGASCRFEPDDLLVLYTDGVIETLSPDGEEFGIERLEALVGSGPASAEEMLQAIRQAVAAHQSGAEAHDDRTLLVVRRTRF